MNKEETLHELKKIIFLMAKDNKLAKGNDISKLEQFASINKIDLRNLTVKTSIDLICELERLEAYKNASIL